MNIIYIISSYDIYGAEKVIINDCLFLLNKGYKIMIVIIRPKGEFPFLAKARKMGIPCWHLASNYKFDITAIFKLKNIIKEQKCDLVHSNGYKSDVISILACRLAKIPVVTTVHGWTSDNFKVRIYERMQALCWRFFDKVICVCDFYRKKAQSLGVPAHNLKVIYNGIIIKNYTQEQSLLRMSSLRVGIIGRLSNEKGHGYFLEAAAEVLKTNPMVSFVIIGDGPERENIEKFIAKLKIKKNIILLGYIENIEKIYEDLDLVVISSLREGLPIVLLEAMQYGKPVIATKVGGIPEVIRDRKDGILVEPRSSSAITNALIELIKDENLRIEFSANAKKRIIEEFSCQRRIEEIEELYSQVIAKERNK